MNTSTETCAICLGSIGGGQGQALFTAECSHIFHFNCIASNVQHGNQICPTCRATWQHLPFAAPPNRGFPPYTSHQRRQSNYVPQGTFVDDEPLSSQSEPTNSTQVPVSQAEYITVTALPEYPALIRSAKGDPFAVLVNIRAPPLSLEAVYTRAPLDLVAVLDVSGSMSGEKLRLLKQAVNFIVDNLSETDRLSITIFSSTATRVTPLKRMTDEGKSETIQAVNSIGIQGSTNIISGLEIAVKVLEQRRQRNPVSSIILLSDGQDDIGHHFISALSHLPACIRSPPTDAIPVHTFGFGQDHDAAALHAIADGSGGTFSYIESIEIIQDAFAQCIGGLLSVVAQQIEINIQSGSPGVRITSVPSGRYRNVVDQDGGKHGVVYIENLYAEEEKKFIVYLFVPEEEEGLNTRLIEVKCSYKDTVTNENVVSDTTTVDIKRPAHDAVSESDREICLEVDRERNRVLTAQRIVEAQALAERGELERARRILTEQTAFLMASPAAQSGDESSNSLTFEMEEITRRMSSRQEYEFGGRAYALSRSSAHTTQRATSQALLVPMSGSAAPQTMAYVTPAMRQMVSKSEDLRRLNAKDDK